MKPILFLAAREGLSACRLQLLADTPISQTSHSNVSHFSCWLITHSAFQIRRTVRLVSSRGGARHHLRDPKAYVTSVYADWSMLIWETPRGRRGGGTSWNTDQNRLGNETLADAALTWQMGNEIVGSFHCVPLSFYPSIHLVIYPSAEVGMKATSSF